MLALDLGRGLSTTIYRSRGALRPALNLTGAWVASFAETWGRSAAPAHRRSGSSGTVRRTHVAPKRKTDPSSRYVEPTVQLYEIENGNQQMKSAGIFELRFPGPVKVKLQCDYTSASITIEYRTAE